MEDDKEEEKKDPSVEFVDSYIDVPPDNQELNNFSKVKEVA